MDRESGDFRMARSTQVSSTIPIRKVHIVFNAENVHQPSFVKGPGIRNVKNEKMKQPNGISHVEVYCGLALNETSYHSFYIVLLQSILYTICASLFLIRWLLISTKTCSESLPHIEFISVVNGRFFRLGSYKGFYPSNIDSKS